MSGKKLMSISVRGSRKEWIFSFYADPRYLKEWRADGLEICEVVNVIPVWVANLGLTRAWCFAQDVFNFKNPLAPDASISAAIVVLLVAAIAWALVGEMSLYV